MITEEPEEPRHERHVRTGQNRDSDGRRVLIDGGRDHLFRRLVKPRVDDLHSRVAQSSGDDLRPAIVAIETDLGDDNSGGRRHARQYMTVILRVIGASPAWPNPNEGHAGYLVSDDESRSRLLLDCGPGVLGRLRAGRLLPIDAIAITHLHLDHWGDLVPWCWFAVNRPAEHGSNTRLWLPPGGHERLREFGALFGREDMFDLAFSVSEYAPGEPFASGAFTVEARPVRHFGARAHGLRVTDRGGAVLAYSGDAGPGPELTDLFDGADLVLCEATLARAERDGSPRGHLTAAEAMGYAKGARLLLTHRPVEVEPTPGVDIASEGLEIAIERA